jgi:hypothetical protein
MEVSKVMEELTWAFAKQTIKIVNYQGVELEKATP